MFADKLKILLIRPPFIELEGSRGHSMDIPLGLLYIAAVLEEQNYDVKLYDARVEGNDLFSKKPFADGCLIGSSWEEVERYIHAETPDIVGITCQFTTQFYSAVKTAELIKKVKRDIVTVVGGPHASALPESFFKQSEFVDFAVVGEGEYVMAEIAQWHQGLRQLKSISGIVYQDGSNIIRNDCRKSINDLDDLPFPAYHLIDLERYFELKANSKRHDVSRPR